MQLAPLIEEYRELFLKKYRHRLLPSHLRALDAITACRKRCGYFTRQCTSCHKTDSYALSCGHRHCPQCQHGDTTMWLERQKQKMLPVEYFMVTITLPEQLRMLAFHHQQRFYTLFFNAAKETLKTLGIDTRHMGGDLGMTMVLHTHTRRLDYHPHLHIIIPAGALINKGKAFKRKNTDYFIHGDIIAKMFRGKLLYALHEECFDLPPNIPDRWVANVKGIGKGLPALQYLSRYLYRGVVSEKSIIKNNGSHITFRYKDSQTKTTQERTLKGEDFIWKLLMHVLPRRFRRVRDYGFLHHNAKRKLILIQYLLHVKLPVFIEKTKPKIVCKLCGGECAIIHIHPKSIPINFRFMRPPKIE